MSLVLQHSMEPDQNVSQVPLSAELRHKTPSWPQGVPNVAQDPVRLQHPVQRRIAEHRIKLFVKRKVLSIHHLRPHPTSLCSFDHGRARIHTQHLATEVQELLGQHSVPTAEIQNPLACLRRQ